MLHYRRRCPGPVRYLLAGGCQSVYAGADVIGATNCSTEIISRFLVNIEWSINGEVYITVFHQPYFSKGITGSMVLGRGALPQRPRVCHSSAISTRFAPVRLRGDVSCSSLAVAVGKRIQEDCPAQGIAVFGLNTDDLLSVRIDANCTVLPINS